MKSIVLLLTSIGLSLAFAATAGNDSTTDVGSHAHRLMRIADVTATSFQTSQPERSRSDVTKSNDGDGLITEVASITREDDWLMSLVGAGLVFYQLHRRHRLLTQRPIPYGLLTDARHDASFGS